MSLPAIKSLADQLERSDPGDARVQQEIYEKLRILRSGFQESRDPYGLRYLEAASLLVNYLVRMGALAGDDVLPIAVRLLRASLGESLPAAMAGKPQKTSTDLVGEMFLGQILLRRGLLTEENISQALDIQRSTGMRFGEILLQVGAVTSEQLQEGLAYQDACRKIRENYVEPTNKKVPDIGLLTMQLPGLKLVGEVLLGEILVERGAITRKQLERALDVQRATGVRIGEALVQTGSATWDQIENALRIQGQRRKRAS